MAPLILATCELADIEMYAEQDNTAERLSIALRYDGVQFVFASDPSRADGLTGYCCFGELPPNQHEPVMWRLMEMNLSNAASGWASFGIDASSLDVVYAFRIHPRLTSAPALLKTIQTLAEQARDWRSTYFLQPATSGASAPAMPGQLA